MRLRSRGNQPNQLTPDRPAPAAEHLAPPSAADVPPELGAERPRQPNADVPPEPGMDRPPELGADMPSQHGAPTPAASPAPIPPPGADMVSPGPAPPHHVLPRTRLGGIWVGLALSAVVLLLLLVFILENQQSADVGYFGAHGHLPLGVALLLASLAGALLVLIPGSFRIIQLRKTARRHRRLDPARQASSPRHVADPTNPRT
jgi:uncharacterized integral membrane protein